MVVVLELKKQLPGQYFLIWNKSSICDEQVSYSLSLSSYAISHSVNENFQNLFSRPNIL